MFAQIPNLPPVLELDEGEGLLTATSRVLITHGPFACSRNPMYLAGTFIWLGWAIFYGSVVMLIWTVVGWTLLSYLKIPQEDAVWRLASAKLFAPTGAEFPAGSERYGANGCSLGVMMA